MRGISLASIAFWSSIFSCGKLFSSCNKWKSCSKIHSNWTTTTSNGQKVLWTEENLDASKCESSTSVGDWIGEALTSFSASKNCDSPFFVLVTSLLKYPSEYFAISSTAMSTLVEVAITYAWLTRFKGTPFTLNGPAKYQNDQKPHKVSMDKHSLCYEKHKVSLLTTDITASENKVGYGEHSWIYMPPI